jgi:hypothetical protein
MLAALHFLAGPLCAVAAFGVLSWFAGPAMALPPALSVSARHNASEANASDAARRDAMRSIPLEKLSRADRAKVGAVLSNVSVFRRMPIKVVDCDPNVYLFLVRHPDVVVNIWEVFNISRLRLQQTAENQFQLAEPAGAAAKLQFVYRSHDTHVVYCEGTYEGPLLARPVKGHGVLVLRSGYVRETNDRYYIASRLDCFLSVEPLGAELFTKAISPLAGKTVDNNFVQTLDFVASLSRTAEVNGRGVRRLASQLSRVEPEVRAKFAELAAPMCEKPSLADRPSEKKQR